MGGGGLRMYPLQKRVWVGTTECLSFLPLQVIQEAFKLGQ